LCTICYIGGKNLGEASAGTITALVILFAALILNLGFILFLLLMKDIERTKQMERNKLKDDKIPHYKFVQKGSYDKTRPNSNMPPQ
jgi:hypothetical protein